MILPDLVTIKEEIMNYSLPCPEIGCGELIEVDASNEEEAVWEIIMAGLSHFQRTHGRFPCLGSGRLEKLHNFVRYEISS